MSQINNVGVDPVEDEGQTGGGGGGGEGGGEADEIKISTMRIMGHLFVSG